MARDPAHARAVGQLLCAALCWSLGGILIKWIDWPPLAVAGGRGLFAALFLFAIQRHLRFTWSRLQLGAARGLCDVHFHVRGRHQADDRGERDSSAIHRADLGGAAGRVVPGRAHHALGLAGDRHHLCGHGAVLRGCAAALGPAGN